MMPPRVLVVALMVSLIQAIAPASETTFSPGSRSTSKTAKLGWQSIRCCMASRYPYAALFRGQHGANDAAESAGIMALHIKGAAAGELQHHAFAGQERLNPT